MSQQDWYQWHNLPHYNSGGIYQVITYRLDDSLPQSKLRELEQQLQRLKPEQRDTAQRQQIEAWLDAGYGSCILKHENNGQLVQDSFKHFHGKKYDLIAWVVMPNHVHVMIHLYIGQDLWKIVQSWKKYSSNRFEIPPDIRQPPHWQYDYWDRYVRNQQHFHNAVFYIENNPVTAGLVTTPTAWRFSSAGDGWNSGC